MSDSGPPSERAQAGVVFGAPADTSQLSDIRRRVRDYVTAAGGDGDLADDFELVVSELATNVIEHTSSPTLRIRVERTPADWILDVSDVEDSHILDDVTLPDEREITGRGLFVVASLVDEVSIVDDGHRHAVRCRRAVSV